jgi:predicted DNA binding CopG/RHH family protein
MAERRIDFRGIPESSDEALRRAHRVGRPTTGRARQLIAIRLDPRLLAELRQLAARQCKPYQALVHEILEAAVKNAA